MSTFEKTEHLAELEAIVQDTRVRRDIERPDSDSAIRVGDGGGSRSGRFNEYPGIRSKERGRFRS